MGRLRPAGVALWRKSDCLFSTYTLTSKMLPGEAFLFSEGREALLLGHTTSFEHFEGKKVEFGVLKL